MRPYRMAHCKVIRNRGPTPFGTNPISGRLTPLIVISTSTGRALVYGRCRRVGDPPSSLVHRGALETRRLFTIPISSSQPATTTMARVVLRLR